MIEHHFQTYFKNTSSIVVRDRPIVLIPSVSLSPFNFENKSGNFVIVSSSLGREIAISVWLFPLFFSDSLASDSNFASEIWDWIILRISLFTFSSPVVVSFRVYPAPKNIERIKINPEMLSEYDTLTMIILTYHNTS